MTIDVLQEYCLSFADVEETMPFGPDTIVYKVKGKIFLLAGLDEMPLRFNVKCDPEKALELREIYSCVLPGYHMNKKHWNTIVADGTASLVLMKQWINDSYNLVSTKKQKKN